MTEATPSLPQKAFSVLLLLLSSSSSSLSWFSSCHHQQQQQQQQQDEDRVKSRQYRWSWQQQRVFRSHYRPARPLPRQPVVLLLLILAVVVVVVVPFPYRTTTVTAGWDQGISEPRIPRRRRSSQEDRGSKTLSRRIQVLGMEKMAAATASSSSSQSSNLHLTERRLSILRPWQQRTKRDPRDNNNNPNETFLDNENWRINNGTEGWDSSLRTTGWAIEERNSVTGQLRVTVGWGLDCFLSSEQNRRHGDTDGETNTASSNVHHSHTTVPLPTLIQRDSVGSSLWPGGVLGAILCHAPYAATWLRRPNHRILEVGCGLGLAGFTTAVPNQCCGTTSSVESVTLTDHDEVILPLLRDHVQQVLFPPNLTNHATKVQVERLDWRDEPSPTILQADVILGTDVAYYHYLLRPLMDTIQANRSPSRFAVVLVGQANRECQWTLYHNLQRGCYNPRTDLYETPWPGRTRQLLYKMEQTVWTKNEASSKEEPDPMAFANVPLDGVFPMAVLVHETTAESTEPPIQFTDFDYEATVEDEEQLDFSF